MRLLREDDVLDIIERVTNDAVENKKPKYLIQKRIIAEIAALDPVDAELVKHGQWIFKNGYLGNTYYCSECEKAVYLDKYGEPNLTDFCPDCGAKMDGGEDK